MVEVQGTVQFQVAERDTTFDVAYVATVKNGRVVSVLDRILSVGNSHITDDWEEEYLEAVFKAVSEDVWYRLNIFKNLEVRNDS